MYSLFDSFILGNIRAVVNAIVFIGEQHGFRPGRSPPTAIWYLPITFMMPSRIVFKLMVAYTGFAKTFERVRCVTTRVSTPRLWFRRTSNVLFRIVLNNRRKQFVKVLVIMSPTSGFPRRNIFSPRCFST